MPSGKKRKRHKMATHKRKKRLRKNRHKKKQSSFVSKNYKPKGYSLQVYLFNPLIDQVVNTELVIDVRAEEVVIALLKDKRLAELTTEKTSAKFAVGDIYYGRVKKIMPGLNAAFVNIGYEKDAFLH